MKIVILLFENYTALDVIGPYEVLARLPNAQILFVGLDKTEYKDTYGLKLRADYAFDEIDEADVLLIPGGFGIDALLPDTRLFDWIKKIDATTKWTVSVCAGSILLAHAGLLDNKPCATHWRRKEQLNKYPVTVSDSRYVRSGKYVTSAGVSAGIDMALYLVSLIAGEEAAKMIQFGIEYDPKPPYDFEEIQKTFLSK